MTEIRKIPLDLYPHREGTIAIGSWLRNLDFTLKFISYKAQYAQDTKDDSFVDNYLPISYYVDPAQSSEQEWQYFLRYIKWFNERIYPQLKG